MGFGKYIKKARLEKQKTDKKQYSLRQVAGRAKIEPSYLSFIEHEKVPPPSENIVTALADDLGLDRDATLSLAGKIPEDVLDIIKHREAIRMTVRELEKLSDEGVKRVMRKIRDGKW